MIAPDIVEQIVHICKTHMKADHYTVFLFGSRASNKAIETSDYDIGIEADRKLTGQERVEIQYDLEEKVRALQTFDVVDFNAVSDEFKRIAKQHIEVLYEQ